MTSTADQSRLQLVVSHAAAGDPDAAGDVASTIMDKVIAAEAWRVVSQVNANMQRFVAAVSSLDIAMQHDPGSRILQLERALLLERSGRARYQRR